MKIKNMIQDLFLFGKIKETKSALLSELIAKRIAQIREDIRKKF